MLAPQPITTTQAPQLNALRMAAICVACAILASLLFTLENTFVHITVIAMGAGVVVPLWYRWIQGRLDWFEPIHIVGGIYFLFFGLGSIWVVNDPQVMAYDIYLADYVPQAAFYCLLGQLAMLAAYFGPWHAQDQQRRSAEWPRGILFLGAVCGVGFVGNVAAAMVERSYHVGNKLLTALSPIAQLAPLLLFAWALGWLLFYSGESTRSQRFFLFGGLVPAALAVLYMTVSDKSLIMTLSGIPVIARWYSLKKVPWTFLLVMVLVLVFVIFPLYNTFRWSDAHAGRVERLETTYRTVQSWGSDTYLRWSLEAFKYRTALINSVAIVVRDTGRWVPFAQGKTIFMPALTSFIPRYLWPDKPVAAPGREFGRLFRVTNYWSRDTFIAVTLPGELYWNFHVPGIVIGMALFGWVLRWIYRAYGAQRTLDPVRSAVYILILVQLAHVGASIALDSIFLIRMLIILAAMRWMARRLDLIQLRDPEPQA